MSLIENSCKLLANMDIRKNLSTIIHIIFLATSFAPSYFAMAAGVGDVILQSRQGEPLHLRIALAPEQGEHVENSCLSLVAPNMAQQDIGTFLTDASLSVVTDGKQQYVDIKSSQASDIAFTKLRLKIKCPGVLGLIKTVTIPPPLLPGNNKNRSSTNPVHDTNVSTAEPASLQEQQKQLASALEDTQQKVKLLEEELKWVKAQLIQLRATPSNIAAGKQDRGFNPSAIFEQWEKTGALGVVGPILLTVILLWLTLYFYKRNRPAKTSSRQPGHSMHVSASNAVPSPMTRTPSPDITPYTAIPQFSFSHESHGETVADDDSMLEEANLYAANGRMEKAVDILKEIVDRNPSKEDAWKLLLSTYSALSKTTDFEKTARVFLKYHHDSPSWSGIQVLGRTLDRDNPLYSSQDDRISAAPLLPNTLTHRPIGDILVEMGALSAQEVMKYLDEFNPRQHGRFGGYLVTRKAITLGQLDLALLRQQGADDIETKPDNLPSLQEIEKLLNEFDPKQHGSVIKFLASRNITLPEQLNQYMLQQKKPN